MKQIKIYNKTNGRTYEAEMTENIIEETIGLMFRKDYDKHLVFRKAYPIHTFFMRFPIYVIYVKSNVVVEKVLVKPWKTHKPKDKYDYMIEAKETDIDIGDEIVIIE